MKHITAIVLYLALCASLSCLHAQSLANDTLSRKLLHRIGTDIRSGYIAPTDAFFKGENQQAKPIRSTLSAHLKYSFRFHPDSPFGEVYPHAYQGIGVAYHTFFNRQEIGTPIALYVFQGSRIAQLAPTLSLDYEWNFGASFGWKKHDPNMYLPESNELNPDYNPFNDVVGSKINAYLNVGFMLNWQLHRDWQLTAGIDLSHFSNGNTHYPNSGVNTIGGRIGLVRTFGNEEMHVPQTARHRKTPIQPHVSYDVVLYGATRIKGLIWPDQTYLVPGSFGILGFNFNPMYNFSTYFKAGLSLDGQYDESANIKDHVVSEAAIEKKFYRPPFLEQFALGVSVRGELVMPIFSVNIGVGHNVVYKGNDAKGFYQILALKTSITKNLFLHVGYQLSRFQDPKNLMLGIGYRFHNKR